MIRDFVLHYQDGYDVVYGVRNSRETDTFFKEQPQKLFIN